MKNKKAIAFILLIILVVAMSTVVCFADVATTPAAGGDIFDKAAEIASGVQLKILGISGALCGVGLAVAACMWGFGNKQQSQMGWEWMKRIVVAFAVINLIPIIINTIKALASIG